MLRYNLCDFYKQSMVIGYYDQMSCLPPTHEKLYKPHVHKSHCSLGGGVVERLVVLGFFSVGLDHTLPQFILFQVFNFTAYVSSQFNIF